VVAENVHVGRQTVAATWKRWDKWGYIKAETVDVGDGISATVMRLPTGEQPANLARAATWVRPEGAPKHGGNQGDRCPKCNSGRRKKEVERETIETTTISCAECGEVHSVTKRRVGETRTLVSFEDAARWAEDDEDEGGGVQLGHPPLERTQETNVTVTVDEPPTTVRDVAGGRRATPPLSTVDTPPPTPLRPEPDSWCMNVFGGTKDCRNRSAAPYCEDCAVRDARWFAANARWHDPELPAYAAGDD
jgi:hypothetical protein